MSVAAYGAFRDANTEVLPIGVDSIPTLREFKARDILIDRDGIVRWIFAEETTRDRRQNAELLERIRALG